MSNLRIALIGAGQIARVTHIPAYKSLDGVEIVGVCDVNFEGAKALAKEFDIPGVYDSHIKLLDELKPDAVSICVPNKFHHDMVMDALSRGCHVFCEKPPAITAKEAEEMAFEAEKRGLVLTYDFHLRHGENVSIIKSKIDEGLFGEIYYARAKWLRRAGVPGWGNFINKDITGGGPLIDLGVHMLDLSLYLMGYPRISYVAASMSNRIGKKQNHGLMGDWDPERYTVEDGLFGTVFFENGTSLKLETSFALNIKDKDEKNVEIHGEKLGAGLFPLEIYGGTKEGFSNTTFPYLAEKDPHVDAVTNFVNACLGKEEVLVKAKEGAYIQKVIEKLYESANTGKPVIF